MLTNFKKARMECIPNDWVGIAFWVIIKPENGLWRSVNNPDGNQCARRGACANRVYYSLTKL